SAATAGAARAGDRRVFFLRVRAALVLGPTQVLGFVRRLRCCAARCIVDLAGPDEIARLLVVVARVPDVAFALVRPESRIWPGWQLVATGRGLRVLRWFLLHALVAFLDV